MTRWIRHVAVCGPIARRRALRELLRYDDLKAHMSHKALDRVETFPKASNTEPKYGEAAGVPWSRIEIVVTSDAKCSGVGISPKA